MQVVPTAPIGWAKLHPSKQEEQQSFCPRLQAMAIAGSLPRSSGRSLWRLRAFPSANVRLPRQQQEQSRVPQSSPLPMMDSSWRCERWRR